MRVVGTQRIEAILRPALRGDGAADEFGGDDWRGRIVEVELELVDVEGVDVAADHHGVGFPGERLEQPLARRGIAVPAVGPGAAPGARLLVHLRHAGLLRDHVPAGA